MPAKASNMNRPGTAESDLMPLVVFGLELESLVLQVLLVMPMFSNHQCYALVEQCFGLRKIPLLVVLRLSYSYLWFSVFWLFCQLLKILPDNRQCRKKRDDDCRYERNGL